MSIMLAIAAAAGLWTGQAITTRQDGDDPQILAQAQDRCMATYAVRLSRTPATDDVIFAEAQRGCGALNKRFAQAIKVKLPAGEATPLLAALERSARPNFMTMLAKIRADRAEREGN